MAEYINAIWEDLQQLMSDHDGFENMKLSKDGKLEIIMHHEDSNKKMIMHFFSLQDAEQWISEHLVGFDELDEDSTIQ